MRGWRRYGWRAFGRSPLGRGCWFIGGPCKTPVLIALRRFVRVPSQVPSLRCGRGFDEERLLKRGLGDDIAEALAGALEHEDLREAEVEEDGFE